MSLNISELEKVIDLVGKDKGIDRKLIVEAIEEAMMTVAKKKYGLSRDIEVKFNEELGEVELFQFMTVVEKVEDSNKEITLDEALKLDEEVAVGDSIGIRMDTAVLSRIAAQTAKQVIVQKVRDAEREIIFNEFQHRKGEVITGLVRRVDRGAVIVDLGRTEGYMPIREQIQGEPYHPGDRIQAYLLDVQLTPKGPRIILSRACPEYLQILFNNEVPEIREGLVSIKAAAREPGVRAKIAVYSRDPDVDPIGACVGVRGSRVQNIVQELKGERIDIVPWDEDISRYVCNALAPAEIQKVIIDDEDKSIEVVVSDDSLSVAIGKRGQNVRLASQLTGWKLDIVSEADMAKRFAEAKWQFQMIPEMTDTLAIALYQSGFEKLADLIGVDSQEMGALPGFDQEKAELFINSAKELVESGKADESMPESKPEGTSAEETALQEEVNAASAENKESAKEGTSDADKQTPEMSSLEEKLRAEIAAQSKDK